MRVGGGRPYSQFPGGVCAEKPATLTGWGICGRSARKPIICGDAVHAWASAVLDGRSGVSSHWQSVGDSAPQAQLPWVSSPADASSVEASCSCPPAMAGHAHASCDSLKPAPAPTKSTSAQSRRRTVRGPFHHDVCVDAVCIDVEGVNMRTKDESAGSTRDPIVANCKHLRARGQVLSAECMPRGRAS